MPENVQCNKCGYLTYRSHTDFAEMVDERQEPRCSVMLRCFAQESNFAEEFGDVPRNRNGEFEITEIALVISRGRECSSFREWKMGFNPKEHLEMQMLEEQQARIERSEQRELEMHRIAESRAVREEGRHEREAKAADAATRNHRIELFIVIVLAAVGVLVQFTTVKMQIEASRAASAAPAPLSQTR